jgi:hypothetical protein
MNKKLRILGAGTVLALAGLALQAQQEPILAVDLTRIAVLGGPGGNVVAGTIVSGGSGYASAPAVTVSGGSPTRDAVFQAILTGGVVTSLNVIDPGEGYSGAPTITIDAPSGSAVTATATVAGGAVTGIAVGAGGSGYTTPPAVTITGGGGAGAAATAVISGGAVTAINLTSAGTGYTSAPTVTVAGATASATASLGSIFNTPFQNESHGPVNVPFTMTALARGTFPVSGFTYNFFVNGQPLGTSVNIQPPGGGEGRVSWAPPQPGAYLLTVKASDGTHNATSLAVRYFATGTAIIGPVDNSLVPNGSSVVLQATATPPPSAAGATAFVSRMEFYVDGELVGTDTTYPYSYIYTPKTTPTTHEIEARGFDNNGVQISPNGTAVRKLYMVTPIGTPPSVRIVNPPTGGSVAAGTPVSIIADAVSPGGFIKNVDFYLNGVQLSSDQTFPFTASWTPQVPGTYEFVAIGFDDKSNAVSSTPITITVTGAFPTASIVNPASSGMTVVQGSTIPVTVSAAGPDGGITSLKKIEFLVNGVVSDSLPKASTGTGTDTGGTTGGTSGTNSSGLSEPFVFNWKSNVPVGTHRLAARVTGVNDLSITSQEITVNVVPNQAPQISISSPTASTAAAVNSATTISVTASDVDGTVESVNFLANGVSIGTATKAPFQISWTPTVAGTAVLTARATDNGGAATTSEPVSITVDPASSSGSGGQTTPIPFIAAISAGSPRAVASPSR